MNENNNKVTKEGLVNNLKAILSNESYDINDFVETSWQLLDKVGNKEYIKNLQIIVNRSGDRLKQIYDGLTAFNDKNDNTILLIAMFLKYGIGVKQDQDQAFKIYTDFADKGDKRAQVNLGLCYYYGQGVKKDYTKTVFWHKKAVEQGYEKAQFALAECYENGRGVEKDLAQAALWYIKAAEQGDLYAQLKVAKCYLDGQGVKTDWPEAFKWWQNAAEQGSAEAQYELGFSYLKGKGIDKDLNQAFYWFNLAAQQQEPRAQYDLGQCYCNGYGVETDLNQALYWYTKAAELGNGKSQFKLGMMYSIGTYVDKDIKKAEFWLEKARQQGVEGAYKALQLIDKDIPTDPAEQYKLGCTYYDSGLVENYAKAFKCFTMSAEQGYKDSDYMLAKCYKNGHGIEKDLKKAIIIYRKLAEEGYYLAQVELFFCHQRVGSGVEKDLEQALHWGKLAAENSDAEISHIRNVALFYQNGYGVKQDFCEAAKWFRKAAFMGYCEAMYSLGKYYSNGKGVKQDYAEAIKWYAKAADQSYNEASEALRPRNSYLNLNRIKQYLGAITPKDTFIIRGIKEEDIPKEFDIDGAYKDLLAYTEQQHNLINEELKKGLLDRVKEEYILYRNIETIAHSIKGKVLKITDDQGNEFEVENCPADIGRIIGSKISDIYRQGSEGEDKLALFNKSLMFFKKEAFKDRNIELSQKLELTLEKRFNLDGFIRVSLDMIDQIGSKNYIKELKKLKNSKEIYSGILSNISVIIGVPMTVEHRLLKAVYCQFGFGIKKDLSNVVQLYKDVIEHEILKGNPKDSRMKARAQTNLAYCYEYGKGEEKNLGEAVRLYSEAANQGYAKARRRLGLCYEFGKGVKQDLAQAIKLYTEAAKQGYRSAKRSLGMCYIEGRGVNIDLSKGINLLLQVVEQGDVQAKDYITKNHESWGSIIGIVKEYISEDIDKIISKQDKNQPLSEEEVLVKAIEKRFGKYPELSKLFTDLIEKGKKRFTNEVIEGREDAKKLKIEKQQ